MSDTESEPPFKRLRSFDPDVTVVLKYANEDGTPAEKKISMHGPTLAGMSKFVDTCLSINMKEKATKTITFDDVTPDMFGLAMRYQEDPVACRNMTLQDALGVAHFYDKYEFTSGLRLCDEVLGGYIETQRNLDIKMPPDDLEKLVEIIAVSAECSLPKATSSALRFLEKRLFAPGIYGYAMWKVHHLQRLQPFLLQNESLLSKLCNSLKLTRDEAASALFPRVFVDSVKFDWITWKVRKVVKTPEFSFACGNATPNISGLKFMQHREFKDMYIPDAPFFWKNQQWRCCAGRRHEFANDWVIGAVSPQQGVIFLWRCKHSSNFEMFAFLPKNMPWEAIHPDVQGQIFVHEPVV